MLLLGEETIMDGLIIDIGVVDESGVRPLCWSFRLTASSSLDGLLRLMRPVGRLDETADDVALLLLVLLLLLPHDDGDGDAVCLTSSSVKLKIGCANIIIINLWAN